LIRDGRVSPWRSFTPVGVGAGPRLPTEGLPLEPSARDAIDGAARLRGMDEPSPHLRLAVAEDAPGIDALMKSSIEAIFPSFYDAQQTASSRIHIGDVDPMLIDDGTYFVLEADDLIVACGGWSRRDKLFTGSSDQEGRARLLDPAREPARVRAMFVHSDWTRRGLGTRILEACESAARHEGFRTLALMATLPGIPLYERFGFRVLARRPITLPDGVELPCAEMEKRLPG
jgi:GNAT superfamily N-acetyltransferase